MDKQTKKLVLAHFEDIKKEANVHRSLVYAAIKDIIKNGLITRDWKLTDAGKIVRL